MGALSSWAMLAFTHHAIVQWAALRGGVTSETERWFKDYAVLGDDVVIGDPRVVNEYRNLMGLLGVECSEAKSLAAPKRVTCEFAKRFFVQTEDASGVPILEYFAARKSLAVLLEMVSKYRPKLGPLLTLAGYGYRAKGSISKPLWRVSGRLRNLLLALYVPGGPLAMAPTDFLRLRAIGSQYKSSDRWTKVINLFLEGELSRLLDRIESLQPLLKEAARLVTVSRDREHYAASRTASRPRVHNWNPQPRVYVMSVDEQISRLDAALQRYPVDEETYQAAIAEIRAKGPVTVQLEGDPAPHASVDTGPPPAPERDPRWDNDGWSSGWGRRTKLPKDLVADDVYPDPHVIDSINETVYREAFLDVQADVRNLRTEVEDLKESLSRESDSRQIAASELVTELWERLSTFERDFGSMPLPRDLAYRRDREVKPVTQLGVVQRWYRLSKPFRSTV
jgi:hypothetical protein